MLSRSARFEVNYNYLFGDLQLLRVKTFIRPSDNVLVRVCRNTVLEAGCGDAVYRRSRMAGATAEREQNNDPIEVSL